MQQAQSRSQTDLKERNLIWLRIYDRLQDP